MLVCIYYLCLNIAAASDDDEYTSRDLHYPQSLQQLQRYRFQRGNQQQHYLVITHTHTHTRMPTHIS